MSEREEVVFSTEESLSVQEIGDFLLQVGKKLKDQGYFTVTRGEEEIEVRPSGSTKLELKYEIENGREHQFEMEIEWDPDADEGGRIVIQ